VTKRLSGIRPILPPSHPYLASPIFIPMVLLVAQPVESIDEELIAVFFFIV
jgi:hypothetical protein